MPVIHRALFIRTPAAKKLKHKNYSKFGPVSLFVVDPINFYSKVLSRGDNIISEETHDTEVVSLYPDSSCDYCKNVLLIK